MDAPSIRSPAQGRAKSARRGRISFFGLIDAEGPCAGREHHENAAALYGLRDPFDPGRAIDAQARLMRDLLRRFGSVTLALAAYNAGSGPVADCGCIPALPQ